MKKKEKLDDIAEAKQDEKDKTTEIK